MTRGYFPDDDIYISVVRIIFVARSCSICNFSSFSLLSEQCSSFHVSLFFAMLAQSRLAKVDSKRFVVTTWNDSSTGYADFVFRYVDFIMRDESGSYIVVTLDERFHFDTVF